MHTLVLSYKSFFKWERTHKKISVPSKYNELSAKQLRHICYASHVPGTIYQQRAYILRVLLNKRRWWFKQFSPVQVYEMSYLTDWLYEKKDDGLILLRPDLTENKLPILRIPFSLRHLTGFRHIFTRFYGPSKGLGNATMLELALADREYLRFLKTQKIEYLDRLIAVLYRERDPKKSTTDPTYDGDLRFPVNDFTLSERAKIFKGLNIGTKLSVFYFFEGCRTRIVNDPSLHLVFNHPKAEEISKNQDLTWINLIIQLGGFTQRSQSEVEETNCYTVLFKLQQTLEIQAKK